MTILTIPGLVLWLFIIPFCIGLIPMPWIPEKDRNAGVALIAGYLVMLPLCWLVTVPCILFVQYDSFLVMTRWFTVLLAAAAVIGIGICIWTVRRGEKIFCWPTGIMEMTWGERLGWLVFFALAAWQLYKAFTMASFDGDDAEYVAQSLVTVQSNTMYRILPYTRRHDFFGYQAFPGSAAHMDRIYRKNDRDAYNGPGSQRPSFRVDSIDLSCVL